MEIKKPESTIIRPSQDLAICINISVDDFEQESCRSYTCTFCKRGFSNAQALGGHMNVHRKDRAARLQESIQETPIATETAKGMMMSSTDHNVRHDESQSSASDEKGPDYGIPKSRRRPAWSSFTDDDQEEINSSPKSPGRNKKDHGQVNFKKPSLQLSLCIESSSSTIISESCIISSHKISSNLSSSPTEVLDLELRLGIDSQATSTNRTVIRD